MEKVAILLFLYSAFFLIGSVIALLWLPLRLFFVLAFIAGGLLQINPQFDIHSLLEYYIPILFFILPSVAKTLGLRFVDTLLYPIYFALLPIAKVITAYRIRKQNKKAWKMLNDFKERMEQRQAGHHQDEDGEKEARAHYEQERRQRQYHEQRRQEERQQQNEHARHEQEKEHKEQQDRQRQEKQRQQQQQRANSNNSYKDPYEILGVTRDMKLEEIKKVRDKLVHIYHPDLGQIPNDAKMKEINNAYGEIKKRLK